MRTKIITTDVACNQIHSWLTNAGYKFQDVHLTMDCFECVVQMSCYHVRITFDSQKQLYSFEMLNGKVKTSLMFKDLKDKFDTYYHINMVIVPTSKRIADDYENVIGIKTVFDNFVGNIQSGYTVKFKELGTDFTGLRVKEVAKELYHVAYVSYGQDGTYEIINEADYEANSKTCTMIESENKDEDNLYEESYAHQDTPAQGEASPFLASLENGEDAFFKDNALVYTNNALTLVFKEIDGHIILVRGNSGFNYITHAEVYGENLEKLCAYAASLADWKEIPILRELNYEMISEGYLQLGDTRYPLGSFKEFMTIIDVTENDKVLGLRNADSLRTFISSHCPPSEVAVTISKLFDSDSDIELVAHDESASEIGRIVEDNKEKLSGVEDLVESVIIDEVSGDSCGDSGDSDSSVSKEVSKNHISSGGSQTHAMQSNLPIPVGDGIETSVKVVMNADKVMCIRFKHGDELYNVSTDLVVKCGLDVDTIVDKTEATVRGGICLTDEERELHKFAKRVTEEETVWQLIYNLFN